YRDLLVERGYGNGAPGEIRERSGSAIGVHEGIARYTVGQRAGLGGTESPRYVTRIDASTNTIVIGCEEELYASGLLADEVNLIRPERFDREAQVLAMIR